MTPPSHSQEIAAGDRFAFGENWVRFLSVLDDRRIEQATASLQAMLGSTSLSGQRFLDVGSGSGLFSLAARRLGAQVVSFDYDPQSVACTLELKKRYFPDNPDWQIEAGSVLDQDYLSQLGMFDAVYSWGVLHHTGKMYEAFENVGRLVKPGGQLFIAIYNDQGWVSRYWLKVKRAYNKNAFARTLLPVIYFPYFVGLRWVVRALSARLEIERGMNLWHDMFDWLGGYPFEVAKPEAVFDFFVQRGFALEKLKTFGGRLGCNEFVFRKKP